MSALDLKLMLMNSGGDGGFVPPPPADYITFISGPFVSDGVSTTDVSATCTHSAGHAVNHYYGIYQNSSPTDEQLIAGTGNGLIYHNSSIGVASGAEEAHSFPKVNFDTIYRLEWLCEEPTKARTRALYVEFSISNPNERAPEWSDVPDFYSIQGVPGSGGEVPATQEQAGALSAESGGVDMNPYVDFFGSSTQSWEASPTDRVDITQDGILSGDVDAPVGVYTVTVTAISEHGVSPKDMAWEVLDSNGWVVDFTDSPLDLKGLEYNSTSETFKDCLSEDKTVYGTTPALVGRQWSGVAYSDKGVNYGIQLVNADTALDSVFDDLPGVPNAFLNNFCYQITGLWQEPAVTVNGDTRTFHTLHNYDSELLIDGYITANSGKSPAGDDTTYVSIALSDGTLTRSIQFPYQLVEDDTFDLRVLKRDNEPDGLGSGLVGWFYITHADNTTTSFEKVLGGNSGTPADCSAPFALPLTMVDLGILNGTEGDPADRVVATTRLLAYVPPEDTITSWPSWTEPTPVLIDVNPPYLHFGEGPDPGVPTVALSDQLVSMRWPAGWEYAGGLTYGGHAATFTVSTEPGTYEWTAETGYGTNVWNDITSEMSGVTGASTGEITIQPTSASAMRRIRCTVGGQGGTTYEAYLSIYSQDGGDEDLTQFGDLMFTNRTDYTFGWSRNDVDIATNLCSRLTADYGEETELSVAGEVQWGRFMMALGNQRPVRIPVGETGVNHDRVYHEVAAPHPFSSGLTVFFCELSDDPTTGGTSLAITTDANENRLSVTRATGTYWVTIDSDPPIDTGIVFSDDVGVIGITIAPGDESFTFTRMEFSISLADDYETYTGVYPETLPNIQMISFLGTPLAEDPSLSCQSDFTAFARKMNDVEMKHISRCLLYRVIFGGNIPWADKLSFDESYARP